MNVYLSTAQAKSIVLQLMQIFPEGVSLCDEDGVILSSSNTGRINRTSPLAFTLLTVVGAAYLLYLAWLSFRAGASMAHLQESRFLGYWGLYRRGVIMNITNPKVTLFFLAFLPQFCAPERGSVALQVMELGLLFMLAAFLVFTAVSALGGRLAHWFNSSPRGQMLMHRVAGLVFVALAVMLIFSCVA